MKKSLIALAVLAASGASFAQSNVTLYGVADVWFGTTKTTDGVAGTSLRQTKLDGGGVTSSRFGLKGSEDLGGGLKANFNFEQGFTIDDGVQGTAGLAFSRQSWVGFSGGFGEVRLGRTTTAFDDVRGASDAVFDSAFSPLTWVAGDATGSYTGRPDNTIYYHAPTMGGFSGALSYSLGEDKNIPANTGVTSTTSMNLTYGAGPVAVQFGYQVETQKAALDDTKYMTFGASYDLGVAKLMATYGTAKNIGLTNGADAKDWQIGVDFPVSAALTVSASYAKSDKNATAGNTDGTGYGIGATYALSKRTTIYGGYEADKTKNPGAADDKHNLLAIGVLHSF